MNVAQLARDVQDLLPALVGALTLLLIVRGALHRPVPARVRHTSKGANAELRELVARGGTLSAISQQARVPHDVVSLAAHLEQRRRQTAAPNGHTHPAARRTPPRSA